MRCAILPAVVTSCLILSLTPCPATGQASDFPDISDRSYIEGRIEVTVTGSTSIKQEIPLNPQASYSSGMTWLQFGVSGAEEPNALITYGETKGVGITVGRGKWIATGGIILGEKSECSGTAKATPTEITGDYACKGVTSHDPKRDGEGRHQGSLHRQIVDPSGCRTCPISHRRPPRSRRPAWSEGPTGSAPSANA